MAADYHIINFLIASKKSVWRLFFKSFSCETLFKKYADTAKNLLKKLTREDERGGGTL